MQVEKLGEMSGCSGWWTCRRAVHRLQAEEGSFESFTTEEF